MKCYTVTGDMGSTTWPPYYVGIGLPSPACVWKVKEEEKEEQMGGV